MKSKEDQMFPLPEYRCRLVLSAFLHKEMDEEIISGSGNLGESSEEALVPPGVQEDLPAGTLRWSHENCPEIVEDICVLQNTVLVPPLLVQLPQMSPSPPTSSAKPRSAGPPRFSPIPSRDKGTFCSSVTRRLGPLPATNAGPAAGHLQFSAGDGGQPVDQ